MWKFIKAAGARAAASALTVAAPAAWAIRVQPMSYDLSAAGSRASRDVRVENTESRPMPVELRVERRHINPDGTERRVAAEDDFLIFPPQGVVPANGFQNFRVQYVGDPAIAESRLYLITVAQLPVETGADGATGVQFLFNLGTSVAVSPEGAQARLSVTSVRPAAEADQVEVTIRNEGNGYARLHNGVWTISSAGRTERLEGEALRGAVRQPLIEPGATRVLNLPVPQGFNRDGATASFEHQPISGA